jgi:GDP/UDP-N,N'-diacetylbacillosamine 2-epimerase (hydrolysing)
MNKKIIAIFSTSRSDFGLLSSFLRALQASQLLHPLLFVGGTHLSKNHGQTISEIEEFGFEIAGKFDYLRDGDDRDCLSHGFADAVHCVADIFKGHQFDYACVLGDRYEILSIVINAILYTKPIIHLNGGEVTEGAIDEVVRSMTTKAAHLHFVACEKYADNVRRMGEEEWRIHNTGTLTVDGIRTIEKMEKVALFEKLNLDPAKETILMTYHPVTQEASISHEKQIKNLLKALKNYNFQLVITVSNTDYGWSEIQNVFDDEISSNKNITMVKSLGIKRYYNLVPYCKFVIGNSSSGIIGVPFFSIPTINIGSRQKGRLRHPSIIDVDYSTSSINIGIQKALSKNFRENLKNMEYKFGDGHSAERMVKIIEETRIDQKLMLKQGAFFIS